MSASRQRTKYLSTSYVSNGYHSGISHLTTYQMDITVPFHIYRVRIVQHIDEMLTSAPFLKLKTLKLGLFSSRRMNQSSHAVSATNLLTAGIEYLSPHCIYWHVLQRVTLGTKIHSCSLQKRNSFVPTIS